MPLTLKFVLFFACSTFWIATINTVYAYSDDLLPIITHEEEAKQIMRLSLAANSPHRKKIDHIVQCDMDWETINDMAYFITVPTATTQFPIAYNFALECITYMITFYIDKALQNVEPEDQAPIKPYIMKMVIESLSASIHAVIKTLYINHTATPNYLTEELRNRAASITLYQITSILKSTLA